MEKTIDAAREAGECSVLRVFVHFERIALQHLVNAVHVLANEYRCEVHPSMDSAKGLRQKMTQSIRCYMQSIRNVESSGVAESKHGRSASDSIQHRVSSLASECFSEITKLLPAADRTELLSESRDESDWKARHDSAAELLEALAEKLLLELDQLVDQCRKKDDVARSVTRSLDDLRTIL